MSDPKLAEAVSGEHTRTSPHRISWTNRPFGRCYYCGVHVRWNRNGGPNRGWALEWMVSDFWGPKPACLPAQPEEKP